MKSTLFLFLLAITLFSCQNSVQEQNTISLELAQQKPATITVNTIETKKHILRKEPQLITYLPQGFQIISTTDKNNTTPIHIFRKDANTTLSLRTLEQTNERDAQRYMKEILNYSANNVKQQENGFYAGESKGTYQQAKLVTFQGRYYLWFVDCLAFQQEEFLPEVKLIVANTQFIIE